MTGPRACRKLNEFLEEARKEQYLEQEKERLRQMENMHEFSNRSSNKFLRSTTDNKQPSLAFDFDNNTEAITFWSYKKGLQDPNKKVARPFFGKNTSFTNDIRDGRLSHSDS